MVSHTHALRYCPYFCEGILSLFARLTLVLILSPLHHTLSLPLTRHGCPQWALVTERGGAKTVVAGAGRPRGVSLLVFNTL